MAFPKTDLGTLQQRTLVEVSDFHLCQWLNILLSGSVLTSPGLLDRFPYRIPCNLPDYITIRTLGGRLNKESHGARRWLVAVYTLDGSRTGFWKWPSAMEYGGEKDFGQLGDGRSRRNSD